MHHEIYNSTREERGVQKNIKIQYLKGGTRVYLKSGASFKPTILLFVFICCLWLILVFHVWLWEQGFVVTPLTDWLPSSPFLPLWRNPPIRMFIPNRERGGSVQRICHLPPWPPGALVISIQVNITGSRFSIMFPHTASCCSGSQT